MSHNIYGFKLFNMEGHEISMEAFKGQVLLVVNVASKCGLTSQYKNLEKIFMDYRDRGFSVLGFPANEFLSQEPGSNAEIKEFCSLNYGIDFPMFQKIIVKGEGQHPLYRYLTEARPEAVMKVGGQLLEILKGKGLLTGSNHDIKWNFEKFLINRQGEVVGRFSPDVDPLDPLILNAVEKELADS
jgi:glutathione peroxidase